MNETSFLANGKQWAWDATSLAALQKCKYFFKLKHIDGWVRKKDAGNVHLWFGKHYATAIERFHLEEAALLKEGMTREEARDRALKVAVCGALKDTWGTDTFDHKKKTRRTLIRSIVWYEAHWREEKFDTYILPDGKPALELTFRLDLKDPLVLCGHLDRVVQDHLGNLFIQDQKTTTDTISSYTSDRYKPNIQFAAYSYAGRVAFKMPINGVMVDLCSVQENYSDYKRFFVSFIEEEIDEWMVEQVALIEELWRAMDNDHFSRNLTSCHSFGTGCLFREVCSRPPSLRRNYLNRDFEQGERWDPVVPRN